MKFIRKSNKRVPFLKSRFNETIQKKSECFKEKFLLLDQRKDSKEVIIDKKN
jgi:hypothetical protein